MSQHAFELILKSGLLLLPCGQLAILADAPETPVGILLSASDAKVVRANSSNPVDAKPSDLLFSGDCSLSRVPCNATSLGALL